MVLFRVRINILTLLYSLPHAIDTQLMLLELGHRFLHRITLSYDGWASRAIAALRDSLGILETVKHVSRWPPPCEGSSANGHLTPGSHFG